MGKKHVGVAVRRESMEISHMTALVNERIYQLKLLLKIAESEPQFASAALIERSKRKNDIHYENYSNKKHSSEGSFGRVA